MFDIIITMTDYVEWQNKLYQQNKNFSDAEKVKEFTVGCGRTVPDRPRLMTRDEVKILIGMKLSELVELAQTVTDTPTEAVEMVRGLVATDLKTSYIKPTDIVELIAHQADAEVAQGGGVVHILIRDALKDQGRVPKASPLHQLDGFLRALMGHIYFGNLIRHSSSSS